MSGQLSAKLIASRGNDYRPRTFVASSLCYEASKSTQRWLRSSAMEHLSCHMSGFVLPRSTLRNESGSLYLGSNKVDASGLHLRCLFGFETYLATSSQAIIGMSLKPCFRRTLILARPCHDSIVTKRPSTTISNSSTSSLQYILKFSISINAHTNSFDEEVRVLYLDCLPY